jgi:glycosyltransferase involved in cell wall biosynthesis
VLRPAMARLLYRDADALVAVSQGAADSLRETFGRLPARTSVICNPVITPALRSQARERVEHPWFAQGEPPVLLGVGRLEPQKDFATLIRAFALVRRQRRARLLILGEGAERAALECLAKETGCEADVQLPGFVPNPYPLIARSCGVVLSSRYEGSPSVVVEALALGVQVAATDCPSGPREILDGGRWGRLSPVGDPMRLADSMIEMLDGPRSQAPAAEDLAPYTLDYAVGEYLRAMRVGAPGTA